MTQLLEINWKPDARTLRQFGFIALGGFGFAAVTAWNEVLMFSGGLGEHRVVVAGALAGLALIAACFSLVAPRANLPIYLGLTLVAFPFGLVLSYVIMSALFYLVVAPLALALRVAGRDPMQRRYDPAAASYWSRHEPRWDNESYFRQF